MNVHIEDMRKGVHEHLRFGEGGIVAPVENSQRGLESIRVYQLDEDKLRVDRQRQQAKAALIFKSQLSAGLLTGKAADAFAAAQKALANFQDGSEEYSMAALDYVEIVRSEIQNALQGGGR